MKKSTSTKKPFKTGAILLFLCSVIGFLLGWGLTGISMNGFMISSIFFFVLAGISSGLHCIFSLAVPMYRGDVTATETNYEDT